MPNQEIKQIRNFNPWQLCYQPLIVLLMMSIFISDIVILANSHNSTKLSECNNTNYNIKLTVWVCVLINFVNITIQLGVKLYRIHKQYTTFVEYDPDNVGCCLCEINFYAEYLLALVVAILTIITVVGVKHECFNAIESQSQALYAIFYLHLVTSIILIVVCIVRIVIAILLIVLYSCLYR